MSTNQSIKPITTKRLDNLSIGGCDLLELANKYGTPLYVIDEETLRKTCQEYKEAFKNYPNIKMMYASKALCTLSTSKIIFDEGYLYGDSENWANWMSVLSTTSCLFCVKEHGKIVEITLIPDNADKYEINVHPNCKCVYVPMRTKKIGKATNNGIHGAEVYLFVYGRLPDAFGRIWYEADINYQGGYRDKHRILYSNDGLIFVSYDHYKTFYEVVQ